MSRVHPQHSSDDGPGKHAGPISDRSCTDILFLILFFLFWVGMVVVTVMAIDIGNPERLTHGVDIYGNLCGMQNTDVGDGEAWRDMRSKKALFFGNPVSPKNLQRCLEACPTSYAPLTNYKDEIVCREGYDPHAHTDVEVALVTFLRGCTADLCECYPNYESFELLHRCVPGASFNGTAEAILNSETGDTAREMLADVVDARWIILACSGIALGLAFFWLVLLRCCGGCMVWSTITVVMLVIAALAALLFYFGQRAKERYDDAVATGTDTTRLKANYITLYVLAGICALVFLIAFLILVFMHNRIQLAVQIVKEGAKVMQHVPSMLVFPIIMFLIVAAFLAYWVIVMLYLATAGTPRFATAEVFPDEPLRLVEFETDDALRRLQAYWVFGGLWTLNFFFAFNEMAIAGAVAHYYFKEGTQRSPRFPLIASTWTTLRYHLGTIAFGSLIIAIVQFIRLVLVYLEKHLKAAEDNACVKFTLRCLNYLFMCVERFLRFISRNAYIVCAIAGSSFCASAKEAFHLLTSNALRLVAVQFVSNFLIFLGRLVVIGATGVIACIWLRQEDLVYWAIPFILILLIAWAISALFFGVYEMVIDALFLCVCEDIERFESYFMSDGLRKYVESSSRSRSRSNSQSVAAE